MSRESAGAAIRELRESRDWSLADFASATGVSVMGLSYLGARVPRAAIGQFKGRELARLAAGYLLAARGGR